MLQAFFYPQCANSKYTEAVEQLWGNQILNPNHCCSPPEFEEHKVRWWICLYFTGIKVLLISHKGFIVYWMETMSIWVVRSGMQKVLQVVKVAVLAVLNHLLPAWMCMISSGWTTLVWIRMQEVSIQFFIILQLSAACPNRDDYHQGSCRIYTYLQQFQESWSSWGCNTQHKNFSAHAQNFNASLHFFNQY